MEFSDALQALKFGYAQIRRKSWTNEDAYLIYDRQARSIQYQIIPPLSRAFDQNAPLTPTYYLNVVKTIWMRVGNDISPWEPTQGDVLAEDWEIAEC